jgi:transcriptional regulator with XRE-family HTH domain
MTIAELRRIRMGKGLSLTEISRRTRIGVSYLRMIEEGQFKGLPPGFYARAFVRAYTEAIGADADVVLGELADVLPAAQAAVAPHPATPGHSAALAADATTLIPDARMNLVKQILDRHNTLVASAAGRMRAVSASGASAPGRRVAAAAIDGMLLASVYLTVLGTTAYACGVSIGELVKVAGLSVFTVLAFITLMYVFMMGGIAGRTIGAMILGVPLIDPPAAPLGLDAILRRSVRFLRADASVAAEVVSLVAPLFVRSRRAA